jgi:hypothetical protein
MKENKMEYALKLDKVTKEYPDFKLDNINISLPRGSIMGFIGENGVSTTTGNDENKGISEYVISDVKISDDDFNVPVQSGFVSPDEPQIRIGNTYINFSPYNLEGTKEVKVKRLNQISDSEKGFTIQAYDFEIEGISEFNVPVYIEMPYYPVIEDNLYEESTIFVQYYNRKRNW